MRKKIYLVYDPKSDTLKGMNESEHELIDSLQYSPMVKYKRIIEKYLNETENKQLALARLDEIFQIYYISCNAGSTIHPFKYKQKELDQIFEIFETLTTNTLANSFEMLLTEDGKRLLPILKKELANKKPLVVCNTIFAMEELNLINPSEIKASTEFYNLLCKAFGKIGTRQAITQQLDKEKITPYRKSVIAKIVAQLRKQL